MESCVSVRREQVELGRDVWMGSSMRKVNVNVMGVLMQ